LTFINILPGDALKRELRRAYPGKIQIDDKNNIFLRDGLNFSAK
jgi:hypothetical protein